MRLQPPRSLVDAETGRSVDMRPPLVKLLAAGEEYELLLAAGDAPAAVRTLVSRVALARVAYGPSHLRVARAMLTLARGYLELRALPAQALQHARHAQAAYRELRAAEEKRGAADDTRGVPGAARHAREIQRLGAEVYLVMAQALCARKQYAEAKRCLARAERALAALGAHADAGLDLALARGYGAVLPHTGETALACEFLVRAVDLAASRLSSGENDARHDKRPKNTRQVPASTRAKGAQAMLAGSQAMLAGSQAGVPVVASGWASDSDSEADAAESAVAGDVAGEAEGAAAAAMALQKLRQERRRRQRVEDLVACNCERGGRSDERHGQCKGESSPHRIREQISHDSNPFLSLVL